ncbi:hypothetical protein AMECASPLE_032052 [Ameca splendens]|uniref:Uncharacterized protein n=1 Tax=Ameca splendens TaxID=208324 RepID=A0ABV0YI77_9TELE
MYCQPTGSAHPYYLQEDVIFCLPGPKSLMHIDTNHKLIWYNLSSLVALVALQGRKQEFVLTSRCPLRASSGDIWIPIRLNDYKQVLTSVAVPGIKFIQN